MDKILHLDKKVSQVVVCDYIEYLLYSCQILIPSVKDLTKNLLSLDECYEKIVQHRDKLSSSYLVEILLSIWNDVFKSYEDFQNYLKMISPDFNYTLFIIVDRDQSSGHFYYGSKLVTDVCAVNSYPTGEEFPCNKLYLYLSKLKSDLIVRGIYYKYKDEKGVSQLIQVDPTVIRKIRCDESNGLVQVIWGDGSVTYHFSQINENTLDCIIKSYNLKKEDFQEPYWVVK